MSVEIVWNAKYEPDSDGLAIERHMTLLPGTWADCEDNAVSAVAACLETYFRDEDQWFEHFGNDDGAYLFVTVESPAVVAGIYEVELDRVVKARTRKMP